MFTANSQIVNIPDANFKAKLVNALASGTSGVASTLTPYPISSQYWTVSGYHVVDTNHDGEIQVSEAQAIKYLYLGNSNITDMTGIESFVNLEYLNCSQNGIVNLNISQNLALKYLSCSFNPISSLNVSQHTLLKYLDCSWSQISNLNVSNNIALKYLGCVYTGITSINVSQNVSLEILDCGANYLTGLDVSQNLLLQKLNCFSSQLTSINVSQNTALTELYCQQNQLVNLNVSQNPLLQKLYCYENFLTNLDLSQNPQLQYLDCHWNELNNMSIKNGNPYSLSFLDFSGNYSIQYICADEVDINSVQQRINNYGLSNTCHVNTYCSFTPGGTFYTLQGNTRFDNNNNGCDNNDVLFPNLKFTATNGTFTSSIISDATGNYTIPVQVGTHSLTPILENPSYFSISPNSISISFPSASSPFNQNFCISANGVHNDLEITFLPLNVARPGFNAEYKIIYKNKGTQTQNGSVTLTFNDTVLDLVSSNPTINSQTTNGLTWNFSDLLPFETREIVVIVNVNSPTETPAVNSGDVLNYTAIVTGATDETPNDNASTLNQMVFNSYDPNDKTCVEGTSITPSMVGQYVHYVIRFENTGTFPAENIVVADVIDNTKFDLTTLIPQSSSHNFVTRVNNTTNKVEFIFENINLPFDDANNDGYVAFKIKTKPTLVVGNTFSNSANIYFDYNFPITTNTYVTTIQALGNQDFNFNNVFSLSPVPTKDVLTITANESVVMTSINIYNTLGQLVQVNTNPTEAIDVSGLSSGSYFIKIVSDKGSSTGNFIKE